MKALSLGWGVQSFTLAAMVALGDLEPVDVAIHADTTHESKLTYEFAARWTPWLEEHGVRVVTVASTAARITTDRAGGGKFGYPPSPTHPAPQAACYAANAPTAGRYNRCAAGCKPTATGSRSNSGLASAWTNSSG